MKINKCLSQVQAVVHKIIFIVALLDRDSNYLQKSKWAVCTYFKSAKLVKKSKSKLFFERKTDALFNY